MQIKIDNYRAKPKQRPRMVKGHVYSPSSKDERSLGYL